LFPDIEVKMVTESDPLLSRKKNDYRKSLALSSYDAEYLATPLQVGRHELYEDVPFTAVMGLQKRERALSKAYVSYMVDEEVHNEMMKSGGAMSLEDQESRRKKADEMLTEELDADKYTLSVSLVLAVFIASMAQFLVGYNTGVMNSPENVVFVGHSTLQWGLAVAFFALGGPLGAVYAGGVAETKGRKHALVVDACCFLLGGVIQTCALNMVHIIIGRAVIGFASGFSTTIVPIYLGEMAPPALRGVLGTMTQFAMVIGILIADLLAFPYSTSNGWRTLFGITPLFAILMLLLTPLLLESPRWLLNKDPDSQEARNIIRKLRGLRYQKEVETEVEHFLGANEVQRSSKKDDDTSIRGDWRTLVQDKSVRLMLISALVLQLGQQFSGINAVFYYSSSFFEGVVDNPMVGTTIVGAVNVVATYAALLLMDSCGRKTLLLWSCIGMLISCIIIMAALNGVFDKMVALVAVNTYVIFFEIGLGPIPWLIVAEMFDAKYVASAMSIAGQLNWSCNFIVGLVFPYLVKYLGSYSFLPFTCALLALTFFVAFVLPEPPTQGVEEVKVEMAKKHSVARKTITHFDIEKMHYSGVFENIMEE